MNKTKTFSICVKEFKDRIVNDVNSSGIPLELIFYILRDIADDVKNVSEKKLQDDLKAYSNGDSNGSEEV